MTDATTTHAQGRLAVLSRKRVGLLVVLGLITLLIVRRGTSELALMRESGSDPQMPIWVLFLVAKLVYWLLAGGVVAGVLFLERPFWRLALGMVLLLGWSYSIRLETWKVQVQQQALAEARDPSTSSARLEQLVQFPDTQGGYERDNRIAANPNATPEILRRLYGHHNLGTLMIMARSPRTPEDILQAMVDHDHGEEWIRKCLKQNPQLPEAMRRQLDEYEQSINE